MKLQIQKYNTIICSDFYKTQGFNHLGITTIDNKILNMTFLFKNTIYLFSR